jgi:LacI family transcriptional regulator
VPGSYDGAVSNAVSRTARPTARDVAKLVGCSTATVSLVVNGKDDGRVTDETRVKVWEAVHLLGYRVNSTASAMARGIADTVVFVCPDPTNPFFSLVIEGIVDTLPDSLSLSLLVPKRGDDYEPSTVQRAMAGDLAGLVLASPGQSLLEALIPTCPVVLLDASGERPDLVSVNIDVAAAARELAIHLTDLGHRRVAYVGIDRDKASLHHRRDALHDQLVVRGADLVVPDLLVSRMTAAAARGGALDVWDDWRAAGVTAVVCGDDLLAFGVLEAAKERGVDVPTQLSVAGFNDVPYSSGVTPTLTTVDLSARELGVRAVQSLKALTSGGPRPASTTLAARLVVRNSTATAA